MRTFLVVALTAAAACRADEAPVRSYDAPAVAASGVDAAPPCTGPADLCRACAAGNAESCTAIAKDLRDVDKGSWYQRGCDGGDVNGCEGATWYWVYVVSDHERFVAAEARRVALIAERHTRRVKACNAHDAHDEEACIYAAFDVENGQGVPADVSAGLQLLVESCERGHARACMSIAQDDRAALPERMKYGRIACTLGEERTCGALAGVFGDMPIDARAATFARGELDRMCKARDGTACWVLAGVYWTTNRAKAAAAITAGCAVDPDLCDYKAKLARGESFFSDPGPVPKLNVKPLLDEAKRRR